MSKVLLIGPMTNKRDPLKTGGIVVLFEDLLKQCDTMNIDYEVIDTNKSNYANKSIAFAMILFFTFIKIPKVTHISIHGTANDYLMIAPSIVLITKLFGKKVSLRKFAGNFDVLYDNFSNIQKKIIDYVLSRSDFNFFETKYLIQKFKRYNKQTFWFPNVRKKPLFKKEGAFQKNFIFIGQVKEEKGVKEILEVSNLLDDTYTFDIYGNMFENMKNIDFNRYKANYKGSLAPENVLKTMSQYDVLLLPTYWKGEGYPGVIIEALSVGIPIIATNLKGISEMLDNRSSILIEPKNIVQVKQAVKSFNTSNYQDKSEAALKQFEQFDSDVQTAKFFEYIGLKC